MVPSELEEFLAKVINSSLNKSIMIWGAPGIGKSSIVQSLAIKLNLQFIDLRLSQLAPTDLRGLPVPIHSSEEEEGTVKWYKPEFLPQSGRGILFLDEISDLKIEKEGSTTTSATVLYDILKKLPANSEVSFALQNENKLNISADKSKFNLLCLPVDNFPNLNESFSTDGLNINGTKFLLSLIHI